VLEAGNGRSRDAVASRVDHAVATERAALRGHESAAEGGDSGLINRARESRPAARGLPEKDRYSIVANSPFIPTIRPGGG